MIIMDKIWLVNYIFWSCMVIRTNQIRVIFFCLSFESTACGNHSRKKNVWNRWILVLLWENIYSYWLLFHSLIHSFRKKFLHFRLNFRLNVLLSDWLMYILCLFVFETHWYYFIIYPLFISLYFGWVSQLPERNPFRVGLMGVYFFIRTRK